MRHWLAASALGAAVAAPAWASDHGAQPAHCSAPDGWTAIAAKDPDFVVFGELHGTQETPELLGSLICSLATNGESVLLGIEIGSTDNAAWQMAWALPHDQFAEELARHGWAGRADGVASQATFDLIVRAHALKSAGYDVGIVAFNGAKDDAQKERFAHLAGQGPHEAAQAENIAEAAGLQDYDHAIVLVGNFHAVTQTRQLGGIATDPMAKQLSTYGSVISLNMISAGGTSWNCQLRSDFEYVPGEPMPADAIECGSFAAGGNSQWSFDPFISLGSYPYSAASEDYDGYYWVGPITASAPAVSAED